MLTRNERKLIEIRRIQEYDRDNNWAYYTLNVYDEEREYMRGYSLSAPAVELDSVIKLGEWIVENAGPLVEAFGKGNVILRTGSGLLGREAGGFYLAPIEIWHTIHNEGNPSTTVQVGCQVFHVEYWQEIWQGVAEQFHIEVMKADTYAYLAHHMLQCYGVEFDYLREKQNG